jgi:signal transduction histidine kinase
LKDYFSDPSRAEAGVRRVLREHRVTNLELALLGKNGKEVVVALNAATFRDREGRLRGVVAAARDITEQKLMREQLEQRNRDLEVQNRAVQEANRLKSAFLASMSHELRTPLDSIIGFSDYLLSQDGSKLNDQQREFLNDILNSGNHLLQLINDILDLAKIESGKMAVSLQEFSPRQSIDEVCSILKPLMAEKKLELSTRVKPKLDVVTLDPLRFKQILYNLLSNAVKFTPAGGKVSIELAGKGRGRFTLTVADSGIGISRADLSRLFQEFEQLESGAGRHYQGSGLGLSLTKKLVELHGGEIEVLSELGKGSTFVVTLPYSARAFVARSVHHPRGGT